METSRNIIGSGASFDASADLKRTDNSWPSRIDDGKALKAKQQVHRENFIFWNGFDRLAIRMD
jgi:hypothetical protein